MAIVRSAGRVWSARLHDIGNFQSRVILTAFYFTILAPFALLTRILSDPLGTRRRSAGTGWWPWASKDSDVTAARRQF